MQSLGELIRASGGGSRRWAAQQRVRNGYILFLYAMTAYAGLVQAAARSQKWKKTENALEKAF